MNLRRLNVWGSDMNRSDVPYCAPCLAFSCITWSTVQSSFSRFFCARQFHFPTVRSRTKMVLSGPRLLYSHQVLMLNDVILDCTIDKLAYFWFQFYISHYCICPVTLLASLMCGEVQPGGQHTDCSWLPNDLWGRYRGGRRPSSDDSLHSPTVIPPSALDKPNIMKRFHRRRTMRWGVTAHSPTMVPLHDTGFVECRWWNDGWAVKTVVTVVGLHDTGPWCGWMNNSIV